MRMEQLSPWSLSAWEVQSRNRIHRGCSKVGVVSFGWSGGGVRGKLPLNLFSLKVYLATDTRSSLGDLSWWS